MSSSTDFDAGVGASGLNAGVSPATGSANRSLFTWVNADALSGTFEVLSEYGTNATDERWAFKMRQSSSTLLRVEIQGSGYSSSLVPSTGQWEWIGIILDGTTLGDHTLYLNDSSEGASGTATLNTGTTENLHIMAAAFFTGNEIEGKIAHYNFHSKALSESEIQEIRYKPEMIPDSKELYYPFWDATPTTDYSGNDNTGTLDGGNSTSTEGPPVMFGGGMIL